MFVDKQFFALYFLSLQKCDFIRLPLRDLSPFLPPLSLLQLYKRENGKENEAPKNVSFGEEFNFAIQWISSAFCFVFE